jgi:transcriptional regulator with XRE-family HTH domain
MGSAARPRPVRLAEKLLEIRTKLNLSQNGLIRRMGLVDEIIQADVSSYELDQREPPLMVLLNYARVANVLVEVLIDDALDLPERLPANPKSEGIKHKKPYRKRGR